jgi:DNA helicase HerA-like ATPase
MLGILDLGNADPQVRSYFSEQLSNELFYNQVEKFSNNRIGNHYVQLYFEEAHNLFPRDQDKRERGNIYSKIAKEGTKYHIGMVYSTQSVTSIDADLLNQTENFFVAHLSSQDEVKALSRINAAYDGIKEDILKAKTKGYIQMLTRSHRFVIPVQVRLFHPINPNTDTDIRLS